MTFGEMVALFATRAGLRKVRGLAEGAAAGVAALNSTVQPLFGSTWTPSDLFASGGLGEVWEAGGHQGEAGAALPLLAGNLNNHNFTQSTEASQPVLRKRSDDKWYVDFSGSKTMTVSSSTALFKYLHDGTGGTVLAFVEWPKSGTADNFLLTAGSTSAVGIQITKSSTAQNAVANICRGVSGVVAATGTISGLPVATGRLSMIDVAYKNDGGATDLLVAIDDAIRFTTTAATANAPSSSNAGSSLTIHSSFGARLYGLLVINRKLSQPEIQKVHDYWSAKYGYAIAATLSFGCGGQSNMSGRGAKDASVPAPMDGCGIFDKSEHFRLSFEPTHAIMNRRVPTTPDEPGSTVPGTSSLLTMQRALMSDHGIRTLIVPSAIGSTSLDDWYTPSTARDRTTLIGAFLYRWKRALREAGGAPVIVWDGHEGSAADAVADYTNGVVATVYQTKMVNLIDLIRTEIDAEAPLIFTQLMPTDSSMPIAGAEAQRQCEGLISGAHLVVAHDVQRNAAADDVHRSAAGQYVVGARQARAVAQHVLGLPVNGTGPRIASITRSGAVITLSCTKAINVSAGSYGTLFRAYANGVEATVSSAARNGSDQTKIDITLSGVPAGPVTLTYGNRAGPANAARTDFVQDADGLPLPLFGPIAVPVA